MTSSHPLTPHNPYTSYNLFFQLEREYILQALLGHKPTIDPGDVFDPNLESYPANAPPLPRRYANLLLPYDWHIPGKTKRRKRIHRKSHGKIGFHELNGQISKAWSLAENEVKNFCVQLSEIESAKYRKRKVKKTAKLTKVKESSVATRIRSEPESRDSIKLFSSFEFDWTVNFHTDINIPQENCAVNSDGECTAPLNFCRLVSHDFSRDNSLAEVDMEDDEIIDIWKSTPIEDKNAIHSLFPAAQFCKEIIQQDETRKSYIDSEYEKFKEIGQQLLTKRRMPARLRRHSVTARQA